MEIKKNKDLYEAPSTQLFEAKIEGIVCQSNLQTLALISFDNYTEGEFSWE